MSRRTTARWRSDLTYPERLCDGGFVRSSSHSRSPSTLIVVAFILSSYQTECGESSSDRMIRRPRVAAPGALGERADGGVEANARAWLRRGTRWKSKG